VVNARAWDALARGGSDSSQPFSAEQLAHPEDWLDDYDAIEWEGIRSVLCLAGGGGQQGPLFAALGYQVTVADLSPEQLMRDRDSAARHGLELETIEADMLDLSPLTGRRFDLVYQPVSALYVPDPVRLYREVRGVLRAGGIYRVEHVNSTHLQVAEDPAWDGHAYRLVRRQQSDQAVSWQQQVGDELITCWHYIHGLESLIGGLLDAGFELLSLTERTDGDIRAAPGSLQHLAAYVPTFFTLLARARA
jgi:SAM-dependent methyltransferase